MPRSIVLIKLTVLIGITTCVSLVDYPEESHENNLKFNQSSFQKIYFRHGAKQVIRPGELPHHIFIFKLVDAKSGLYRAFCAGSVITEFKVLSAAHCLYTNRKRKKYEFPTLRVVGGIVDTVAREDSYNGEHQWRMISRVITQMFFRYPAYNLALVIVDQHWIFNKYVAPIPYAELNQEFDGYCKSVIVKATTSWSLNKTLFIADVQMISRKECQNWLFRSTRLYHCSNFIEISALYSMGAEGAGLICYETNDPAEVKKQQGLLVGVTTLINKDLPTLHTRVGIFNKWITDNAKSVKNEALSIVISLVFIYVK